MDQKERKRKIKYSLLISIIASTILAVLTYFALPGMRPVFYVLVWFGAFFVWWMWTMMATHY